MSLPTLYKLSADYQCLVSLPEDEDGTIANTLEALAGDIQTKGVNIVKAAQSIKAVSEAKRNAAKELAAQADREERHADRLLAYLQENMERTGITAIECEYFTARLRTNPPAVNIDPAVKLPDQYLTFKPAPDPVPNKVMIKAALKVGTHIDGCTLTTTTRLEIKP